MSTEANIAAASPVRQIGASRDGEWFGEVHADDFVGHDAECQATGLPGLKWFRARRSPASNPRSV